jgi:hypothetical protein
LEDGISEIRKAIESGVVKDYRDKAFSNYEHMVRANGDLLTSDPSVQLYALLEPADAYVLTVPQKAVAVGAS